MEVREAMMEMALSESTEVCLLEMSPCSALSLSLGSKKECEKKEAGWQRH